MPMITNEMIKQKARAAYLKGRLSAQAPNPICRNYTVQTDSETGKRKAYRCAVAQAMPLYFCKERPGGSVGTTQADLEALGYPFEDAMFAQQVQAAHDNWANVRAGRGLAGEQADALNRFLDLIELPQEQRH